MKTVLGFLLIMAVVLVTVGLISQAFNDSVLIHCTRVWAGVYICGSVR